MANNFSLKTLLNGISVIQGQGKAWIRKKEGPNELQASW